MTQPSASSGGESTAPQPTLTPTPMPAGSQVARDSAQVVGWTLLSRALGYVRDAVCAAAFGMGLEYGAFLFAWMVPNLFRRFLGEGALASAFVPEASKRHDEQGRDGLRSLLASMQGSLGIVLLTLGALLFTLCIFTPPAWLEGVIKKPGQAELFLQLSAILVPYLIVCCTLALWMGALNSVGHFRVPASSPALLNVVWIGVALVIGISIRGTTPMEGGVEPTIARAVRWLAWGMLLGGSVQVVQFLIALKREGLLVRPRFGGDAAVARIWYTMAPMVLGLAVVQLNLILDQVMAVSFVAPEANNYTYHANRLLQFPIGVIGTAVATVAFPLLTRLGKAAKRDELGVELEKGLRLIAFLAVPAGCVFALLAHPIVKVLFEHGKVTAADTAATSWTLTAYAIGVPFLCSVALWARAFYALDDRRTPVRLAAQLVVVNAALNFALVFPLGVAGLALATSICAILNSTTLCIVLKRKHAVEVFRNARSIPWAMFVVGILSATCAMWVESLLRGPLSEAPALIIALLVAAAIYLGTALLCNWPEMWVLRRLWRRA